MIRLIWLHFIFENIIWFQNVETTKESYGDVVQMITNSPFSAKKT